MFVILWGHFIPIIRFSCLLWKLLSFIWSLHDNPQVPQLPRSMLLTNDSGVAVSLALFFISFSILFRRLIVQCLTVLSSFLYLPSHIVLILTWWRIFILLLFLLMVVFSVLRLLTSRFMFINMVFAFWYIFSFFFALVL